METAVGACNGVRYSVDVRYWECPLIESPLYMCFYVTITYDVLIIINSLILSLET